MRVEVEFTSGEREDVTQLCRFESVDPEVAKVTRQGEVTAVAVGDTAIVVRYGADTAGAAGDSASRFRLARQRICRTTGSLLADAQAYVVSLPASKR